MTSINPFSRRSLLIGLGAASVAGLVSACSSNDKGTNGQPAASGNAQMRKVTDASNTEVEVPADPKRVVVLHFAGTQACLDLGVVPIGTGQAGVAGQPAEESMSPEQWAKYKDMTLVMQNSEPIIEKIAELKPDLILAHNAMKPDALSQIKAIGPVFQFTLRGGQRKDWAHRVDEVAEALNKKDALTKLKSDWAGELDAAKKKYADKAGQMTVAVLGAYDEGQFYAWGQNNMQGTVLLPLGVKWSAKEDAAVAGEKEPEADVSVEKIVDTLGDANIIFYDSNMRAKPSPLMQRVLDSALFKQLPAAQKGNVFPFGKNTIAGYTDARYSLQRVQEGFDKFTA